MTTILALAAVGAALIAALGWWIRRENMAVYPVGRQPRELRPLPAGCELGAQLMAAAAGDEAPAGGGAVGTADPAPPADAAPAVAPTPPKAPPKRRRKANPERRSFLRSAWLLGWLGTLGGFGGASLAFLWPDVAGGFGARVRVGTPDEVLAHIRENREPFAFPSGRLYLIEYNPANDPDGVYADITDGGLMALWHKCVHLGCKVPWCLSSQWFECPCHGSRYNRWGEYRDGPAPRGLDRFPVTIEDGQVVVNTGEVVTGPSRQMVVLDQEREGPSCL